MKPRLPKYYYVGYKVNGKTYFFTARYASYAASVDNVGISTEYANIYLTEKRLREDFPAFVALSKSSKHIKPQFLGGKIYISRLEGKRGKEELAIKVRKQSYNNVFSEVQITNKTK